MSKLAVQLLTAPQAERVDRIKTNHAALRKTFENQIDLATFVGIDLLQAKEEVGHGHFIAWCETHLPDITHRSCTRYMDFVIKLDTVSNLGFQSLQLTDGELPLTVREDVQKAIRKIGSEGKTWTALYRDLGFVADPPASGGFRPPEAAVQKWLKKNHTELAGTKFADLPEPLRKQFQKQFKPEAPSAALTAEGHRAAGRKWLEQGAELLDRKRYAHWDDAMLEAARTFLHDLHATVLEVQKKRAKKGASK